MPGKTLFCVHRGVPRGKWAHGEPEDCVAALKAIIWKHKDRAMSLGQRERRLRERAQKMTP